MWRHVAILLLVVVLGWLTGAAMEASAEPGEDLVVLASEANVDPVEFEGAVLTVGESDPRRYLIHAGHLVPPRQAAPPPSVWTRLAQCESSGNWASNSNPRYKGGLQFDAQTWAAYGGRAYASSAHRRRHRSRSLSLNDSGQLAASSRGRSAVEGWVSGRCGQIARFESDGIKGHQSTCCCWSSSWWSCSSLRRALRYSNGL